MPVTVTEKVLAHIFAQIEKNPKYTLTVDLAHQHILEGDKQLTEFAINPYKKLCLLNGYDDVDYLLSLADKTKAYEKTHSSITG